MSRRVGGEGGGSAPALSGEAEQEVLIAYLGGVPIKQIQAAYGVSRSCVYRLLRRARIETDRKT